VWCAFGTADVARTRLAAAMEDFYRTPFDKFERYCPCGSRRCPLASKIP